MTVLVAYGTMCGSTAEIAGWIAEEMRAAGLDVDVRPAGAVDDVDGYEALVLGGAVYAAGWHVEARKFANRFGPAFAGRPVWLFSSGPLDGSTDVADPPPIPHAKAAMHQLRARDHATFGGRLSDDAPGWLGLVARRMARQGRSGDFRNPNRVRAWAREIAAQIRSVESRPM